MESFRLDGDIDGGHRSGATSTDGRQSDFWVVLPIDFVDASAEAG